MCVGRWGRQAVDERANTVQHITPRQPIPPPASHLLQPVSQPPILVLGTVPLQLGAVCEGGQHTLLGKPNAQLGLCVHGGMWVA